MRTYANFAYMQNICIYAKFAYVCKSGHVYTALVNEFKKIIGRTDFSDLFRKILIRHKRIGYDLNVMRQSAY